MPGPFNEDPRWRVPLLKSLARQSGAPSRAVGDSAPWLALSMSPILSRPKHPRQEERR